MVVNPRYGRVSKVTFIMTRRGVTGYHTTIGDLVWVDGVPTLVIEWGTDLPEGDVPIVSVPLDRAKLQPLAKNQYVYDGAIEDPRTLD